ncbi:MAG: hypothetical protein A3I75_08185 [Deltaproteobacteria bacterium RIFCSPLOWO2_02_FULL_50_16]|nr:MAG: hypothetical protein A2053_00450 [Deltaproteobacteria bacterium GWA2_50_8]OGQ25851.1 MAG: hypothetical protein A3B79_07480 [Deltaproteobacteria bacterium RIFCSPHIGHO2_02_FULL_50_15]OGQ55537.1 MAG: hypothetical protein A3I75_08185 [Deltaproteobacteria bacterium RIFCSPLOWO2_02_FULL_50_16]OGQ65460.1 MAG: hypothetical protein A3F89_06615 [Deltaproteobacteria bacterium RIFCSPLOWO2_12_FULL_50_11]
MSLPAFIAALPTEIKGLRKKMKVDLTVDVKPGRAYQGTLKNHPLLLSYSEIGKGAAERHVQCLIKNFPITHMIAIGFAGSMVPQYNTGDLIIAPAVKSDDNGSPPLSCHEALIHWAETQSQGRKLKFRKGNLLTVREPLLTVHEKMMAHRQYDCTAVDMESAAIARIAHDNKIPFLAVRAIFDTLDVELPQDESFLTEESQVSVGKVLAYGIKQPRVFLKLPQWGMWAGRARNSLTYFVESLIQSNFSGC